MKCIAILCSFMTLWASAYSASCVTPLGRQSQCVSIYDCRDLLTAFEQRPLKSNTVSFLRQSQCGFEGYVPRVCCGPMPSQTQERPTTRKPVVRPTKPITGQDPIFQEDSNPSPRSECGIDTNGDRLYGGQFTDLDEFPWMALLGYQPPNNAPLTYQCGGVLINHRYVLTAAHCVVGEIETAVGLLATARLGEYDIQSDVDCLSDTCADPVQEVPVHSGIAHPGFTDRNKNRKDDIALVRLAKRVKYSYYVQPICLVDNSLRLGVGNDVFVAGWGKTESGKSSPVKLKLSLPIYSKSDCVSKYRSLGAELTDGQLCAGGIFAQDACRGDSGGPLMRRTPSGVWETVAVVSFGYGCGREGWPGVYTSVSSYVDWIKNTMRSTNI